MSKTLTEARLREVLDYRFGGELLPGEHELNGQACMNELANFTRALPDNVTGEAIRDYDFNLTYWHHDPGNAWDVRPLNDIDVYPAVRTEVMIPLYVLYQHARLWPVDKQQRVTGRIVIGTVREVLPLPTSIPEHVRERCASVTTLVEAHSAMDSVVDVAHTAKGYASIVGRAVVGLKTPTNIQGVATYAGNVVARVVHETNVAKADVLCTASRIWTEALAAENEGGV